jgi:hypothetical protein
VLQGRRLHPIFGVIARPAWETIAEPALPRSLPLIAYLNLAWDTSDTSRIQENNNELSAS